MLPLILFALSLSTSFAGKLPAGTVFCKRKDPTLNDCLKSAIQKSLPHFMPGIPELEVESIDPLVIKSLVIDRKKGNGSPVDIDLSWHDVQITGIQNAEITDAKADWDNGYVSFNADVKEPVVIKGRYLIDGVILVLPINGEGDFETKLENFKGHIKVHGKEEMSGGKKYFMVDRLVFTFDVGHMTIKYANLFNGDPVLGESMNNFVNENWRDILDEMKVTVETAFSEHWQAIAEKVFHAVPMDEIALQ